MNKKLATLRVNSFDDPYDKVVKALENAGFILVLNLETMTEKHYIIAESEIKPNDRDKH